MAGGWLAASVLTAGAFLGQPPERSVTMGVWPAGQWSERSARRRAQAVLVAVDAQLGRQGALVDDLPVNGVHHSPAGGTVEVGVGRMGHRRGPWGDGVEPGPGATFVVRLPRYQAEAERTVRSEGTSP